MDINHTGLDSDPPTPAFTGRTDEAELVLKPPT